MLYEGLIRTLPRRARILTGTICILSFAVLGILAYLTSDGLMILVASVVGFPFGLVGLSLLWGKARQGHGVISPMTLRLIGGLVVVVAFMNAREGNVPMAFGASLFATACFALARQRKVARSRS